MLRPAARAGRAALGFTGVRLALAADCFRSLPVWRPAPIVGGLIGDAGRYLLSASLVIVLGLVMGYHAGGGPLGVLAAVVLVIVFAVSLSGRGPRSA